PTEVRAALDRAVARQGQPSLIVARTHIGIGAPTKQDTSKAHGEPLGAAEVEGAKKNANWPLDPFHVSDEGRHLFTERAAENRKVYDAWQAKVAALGGAQA